MPLDTAAGMLLSLVNSADAPAINQQSPAEAREMFKAMAALSGHEGAAVASTEAREIAGVPCQVVTPVGDGPFPVLVWFHGGGWVIGSAEMAQSTCCDLAAAAGAVVVNVDYGLAPENPFPGPVDESVAVTRWVLANAGEISGDAGRVAVGGDSAGGNLAAVTALEVPGLVYQLLVYPATDLTLSHRSIDENGEGYMLTKDVMVWFIDHYLGDSDRKDPRISPLYATDDAVRNAPPAMVITAEYDPLRDEGEAYAQRLRDAGVAVTAQRYDGQIHGFFGMPTLIPDGAKASATAAEHLRTAFGG